MLFSRWVLSFGVVTAVPCSKRSEFADSSLPADTGFGLRTDYAGEGSLGWEDDTVGGVPLEETAWGVEEKDTRPPHLQMMAGKCPIKRIWRNQREGWLGSHKVELSATPYTIEGNQCSPNFVQRLGDLENSGGQLIAAVS